MQKITFGTPEKLVPSYFCKNFNYIETEVRYPVENITFKSLNSGCTLEFPLEDDCHIFGFGLQIKHFDHRGQKLRLDVNADPQGPTGESHAPVPFFVTNKGYGMYFDTARYAEFYCGKQKNQSFRRTESIGGAAGSEAELYAVRNDKDVYMSVRIPAAKGIDVYIIEGDTITDIVSQYNMLSGGGPRVPEWGLGMLYRCFYRWGAKEIMNVADYLRDKKIPCDTLGLEPGWHSHSYSCSYRWNKALYPDPDGFIAYLRERGFHLNLWEQAFVHPDAPFHDAMAPYSGDWLVWGGLVPDFSLPEARKLFAGYHREQLISKGIDGFKLDECDSSDYTGGWSFPLSSQFPSGLEGDQYHSLLGTLFCQTQMEALGERLTLSEIRSMGALAAPYPFVLYSDLYDHKDFIRGLVNSGFSGLLWAPEFRSSETRDEAIRRMQCVIFSTHCLVNGWNYEGIPWVELDCEAEFRELLELRYSLIPMLKEAFDRYHDTGNPPIRALVMDFSDDARTYTVDDQFLFCEDILVAPIAAGYPDERDVYLPVSARWADFFTGEEIDVPEDGIIHVETKGIPVYRRIRE